MTHETDKSTVVAAVGALVERGVPTDVQELLMFGNPDLGCKPGALEAAMKASARVATSRSNFVPAPQMFHLHHACNLINQAFPQAFGCFLVGSSMERRDYRDVDVRMMLPDEDFDRLFPKAPDGPSHWQPTWALLCITISEWLRQVSGLPVDFQFQKQSVANGKFGGRPRNALGFYIAHGDARK